MGKEKNAKVIFSEETVELFLQMKEIQEKFGIKRLNTVILTMALLEEQESAFYECLCKTNMGTNPYKTIIEDCEQLLKSLDDKEKSEINENEKIELKFEEANVTFFITEGLSQILNITYSDVFEELCESGEIVEVVEIFNINLFATLMENTPRDVLRILKNNGVDIDEVREYLYYIQDEFEETERVEDSNKKETLDEIQIPRGIADFTKNLTNEFKDVQECEILGRDEECRKIMQILQKRGRKNAILIGEPGVGKTAIAERIAYLIAKKECPEQLKDHIIIQVDVNNSVAGTIYRGMAEERFKNLVEFLNKHDNIIVFIDEIHMVLGAGSCSEEDSLNMSNALKPFLASKKAKVIGATTAKEFEKIFSKDEAFRRRFETVHVREPKSKEVYPMLEKAIKAHEKYHNVKITKEMVEYAVLISSCFNHNTKNPDRTNDLIDFAMVVAKENGKEYVDKASVLEKFGVSFEKFEKMDIKVKIATAYHEAGHYVVGRKSGYLKDLDGIAISIMPTKDYMGVTVYDSRPEDLYVNYDRKYYIDYLAHLIAGREAELLYEPGINGGAKEDLEKANKIAYEMVTQLGIDSMHMNRIYLEKYPQLMNEAICDEIEEAVNRVIKEATDRAIELIHQNRNLIEKLVTALLEKGILDKNELDEICKE